MPLLYLIILLLLWRFAFWKPRTVPGVTRQPPLLIGHRGVRGKKPENTLEAFKLAFDEGLDGIECDVQRTKDGRLVLFHDAKVKEDRLTQMRFHELETSGEPFGTLEELFELAKQYPGTLLNLELKTEALWSRLEHDTLFAVKEAGLLDRVIFSSFNPLSLLHLRLLSQRARLGLLYSPDMPWYFRHGWLAPWFHVDAIHPHESQVSSELLRRARDKGLAINTWTVNEPMRITSLYEAGVNAIIGDDPAVLCAAATKEKR
ncbi:MAG: glycerophosphodiester phosphodiesterase [Trueperaceae bacterium]|nr:glycerophosphodiester phosphodiesterase [Trueperaceae bacterium]